MKSAILTDLTKCAGCEACVMACKEANGLSRSTPTNKLSATTWTSMQNIKGVNVRRQCMHCEEPACASACPVGALKKTKEGPVTYDASICMGCRYCLVACPFNVPTYEWDKTLPKVQKCVMCYEKAVKRGKQPACTSVCPTGATVYGDRDVLIKEALKRIKEHPDRYINHVYGMKEAGGTSVLYLSAVPFESLGFPASVRDEAYPELTWKVLSKIPNVVSTAGVTLLGVWWIINRRIKLAEEAEKTNTEK